MSRFRCSRCGESHPGPPMAYASTAPARWYELDDDELSLSRLDGELCTVESVEGREWFVRGNVEIPVAGAGDPLVFSAWVALDAAAMATLVERWEHPERASDPAYPGMLANDLPGYPSTLGLATELHSGPAGDRARAVVMPTAHPLADEQWEGIDMSRVRDIAEYLAHPLI